VCPASRCPLLPTLSATACLPLSTVHCPPQVEKKFPNKEAKLIVADSDGRTYAIEALEALDEAGYVNMVGLKG
jgi:hypothetical protein